MNKIVICLSMQCDITKIELSGQCIGNFEDGRVLNTDFNDIELIDNREVTSRQAATTLMKQDKVRRTMLMMMSNEKLENNIGKSIEQQRKRDGVSKCSKLVEPTDWASIEIKYRLLVIDQ